MVIFNSYVSLPEGNNQEKHSWVWVSTYYPPVINHGNGEFLIDDFPSYQ